MAQTTVERQTSTEMVEAAARALAASEGYDWANAKPEMMTEYRRQARVALGAGIEYLVENNIRLTR